MKDKWVDLGKGKSVYVQNNAVVRATRDNDVLPAHVYRWDKQSNCYIHTEHVKYETFRRGYKQGRYDVF